MRVGRLVREEGRRRFLRRSCLTLVRSMWRVNACHPEKLQGKNKRALAGSGGRGARHLACEGAATSHAQPLEFPHPSLSLCGISPASSVSSLWGCDCSQTLSSSTTHPGLRSQRPFRMVVPHVISRATLPTAFNDTNLDAPRRISATDTCRQSTPSDDRARPSR
jgi:hypothetical protein